MVFGHGYRLGDDSVWSNALNDHPPTQQHGTRGKGAPWMLTHFPYEQLRVVVYFHVSESQCNQTARNGIMNGGQQDSAASEH